MPKLETPDKATVHKAKLGTNKAAGCAQLSLMHSLAPWGHHGLSDDMVVDVSADR